MRFGGSREVLSGSGESEILGAPLRYYSCQIHAHNGIMLVGVVPGLNSIDQVRFWSGQCKE